ncbi:MAG TPA: hypothetical protein EYH03_04530 [Chromatiales bacterium]|nr:hypothetical protein [Chromatiales bacterium]
MKKIPVIMSLAAAFTAFTASAVDDAQYQSIVRLGELNGIALHCKYVDQTRRMKKAMIASLPKRRALGYAFDDETNKSFLNFIEKKQSCPAAHAFVRQVDEAIADLRQSFSGTTRR